MTDIFISYASEDRERVHALVELFEESGHSIWWDRKIGVGTEFDREIESAIDDARCMIVAWSEHAVASEWVRTEAMEGMDRKILVPVQLDDTRPPLAFRRIQAVQLIDWPARPCQDEIKRLQASVRQHLSTSGAPVDNPLPGKSGRRNVTHISGRIQGFENAISALEPMDVEEVMGRLKALVADTIARRGGVVNQFTGATFQAVFGVPVTHENDALRGMTAGRKLQQLFSADRDYVELGMALSLGIATGQVIAHGISSADQGMELLGQCIEASTALAYNASGGEILACSKTRRLTEGYFRFESREGGGDANAVVAELAEGELTHGGVSQRLTEFSGRDLELAMLGQALERVQEGVGQVVCIVGEAGTGKSRLVREFQMQLEEDSVHFMRASCYSHVTDVYAPIRRLLYSVLKMDPESADSAALIEALKGSLSYSPHHLPALLDVLELEDSGHQLPEHLEARDKQTLHRAAVTAALTAGSGGRIPVIVLEDWHWSDSMSDGVLRDLVGATTDMPLLVAVVHRPEYFSEWHNQANVSMLRLQPLSLTAASKVAESVIGVDVVPGELVRLLHSRTGGNPFFLEELSKALIEESRLRVVDGRLEVSEQLDQGALPDSVQAVIRSRLDQLDAVSSSVLNIASVIGRTFGYPLLERVFPAADNLEVGLRMLLSSGLVLQTATYPERRYKFRHVLTQSVAYDAILATDRQTMHQQIGDALSELNADTVDTVAASLAYHYERSADPARAIAYLVRAGDAARRLSASHQAVDLYQRALALLHRRPPESVDPQHLLTLYLALSQELTVAEGYASPALQEAFERARELSHTVGDESAYFPALWGRWRMEYNQAEFARALETARELRAIAERLRNDYFLAGANTALSVSYYWLGQLADSLRYSADARYAQELRDDETYGDLFGVVPSMMNLSFRQSALLASGRILDGLQVAERIDRDLDTLHHLPTRVLLCFYRGVTSTQVGDHSSAVRFFEEVIDISDRGHFPHWRALAEFQLARHSAFDGDRELALQAMEAAEARLQAMGVRISETACLLGRASVLRLLGRRDDCLALLRSERPVVPLLFPELLRQRAEILCETDDAAAHRDFLRAVQLGLDHGNLVTALQAACSLVALERQRGQVAAASFELLNRVYMAIPKDLELPMIGQARDLLGGQVGPQPA